MADSNDTIAELIHQLKSGAVLVKHKPSGKKYSRQFFLHEREGYITYDRSYKFHGKPRTYNLNDIDEVRTGFEAQTFDQLIKNRKLKSDDQDRAFSIIYDNHRKGVHCMAPDIKTRDAWVTGLQHLISQRSQKRQYHLIGEDNWILEFFHAADKNKSNTLSKKECRDLLVKCLNVEMSDNMFEQMFNKIKKTRNNALNPDEFLIFFKMLTRRKDLYEIMKQNVKYGYQQPMESISMDKNELLNFLRLTKNENTKHINNLDEVQKLLDEFELNAEFREKGVLGLDGFRNMLLSRNFDITESAYSRQIYQDMTRPICDYYINTSHNTYLFYSQVSGESNPEAYNRVLLMGCRAVEFDCYDGPDGKPIVKHAFTLVKPCPFESIIRRLQPNLFKASPYPVIFNIENHCSLPQQKQMAHILKTYLGDQLVTKHLPNRDPSIAPSPEDLKYKVLVRSVPRKSDEKFEEDEDNENSTWNPLRKNVEPELAELFLYFENVPYRDYGFAKANYSPYHSSSLAEKTFLKHAENEPLDLILQTTWRLLRVYPDGLRQDSSNLDPISAWNFGVQMAALNYQTDDDRMALYYGKFRDNGCCGYILKPEYLINVEETRFNPLNTQINFDYPQTLTITVISGQFLPRSSAKSKDIPDPYVRISTHGLSCDQKVVKTQVVQNNGFDPVWNETFEFPIKFPQMCLIFFSVLDYDSMSADDRLAYFSAPVTMIQAGYRHITLRANNNDETHSTLFVYVDIQNHNN
ncbi:unnamed protein product [Rotaria sordida]|uniref:Phosphoinositide phospholipase C n=1 Tax=Rotaria sordida TaxID=392033 RepID=A0A819FE77_9BILA|nr:unnamed protein product [Rotaria sordida]CAF3866171.1 unnamed protein product [Rotaria sordida]